MVERGRVWSESEISPLLPFVEMQQVVVKNVRCSYCAVINQRRCTPLNGLNVPGQ